MRKKAKYNVAVVGVGAVGEEMLRVIRQRNFPVDNLKVFARSARKISVEGIDYNVDIITPDSFEDIDIALFAGTEGEKGAAVAYANEVVKRGGIVIDNGADFRMDKDVPLVVPEVNAKDIKKHQGIIANPNCSTIQMVVVLWAIYKKVGIKRIIATTFQAASGAGRSAVDQLEEESKIVVENWPEVDIEKILSSGKGIEIGKRLHRAFSDQLAFNIFPHIGSFGEYDYTTEEWKLVKETHKIMHNDKIKISATCVRVSVRTGHCEAIYIETKKPIEPDKVRDILSKSKGIVVIDDPKNSLYPMPKDIEGKDEVFVGRIRKDPFVKNGLWLWVVADNLRKGAATNAVQIAECVISN